MPFNAIHMPFKRYLTLICLIPSAAHSQKPVISPGGVVNAASYVTTLNYSPHLPAYDGLPLLFPNSIASIFGTNLATSTETAQTVPRPTRLAGTSVFVSGVAAPLFYVSPSQINFEIPYVGGPYPPAITVSTAGGDSDPYPFGGGGAPGLFTQDGSGCGPGLVFNVNTDGTWSLNSPQNSASPGQFIAAYGTGQGNYVDPPPAGTPAPSSPLVRSTTPGDLGFDFTFFPVTIPFAPEMWGGLAPGLIGVDQHNRLVPDAVREGCAVPVVTGSSYGNSRPVTISIHKGGGACVDPPEAGYGQILWEKTVTATPSSSGETETLSVSLQASPGRLTPPPSSRVPGQILYDTYTVFGPSCPVPGYRSLDAGAIAVQGPGLASIKTSVVPLGQGQVSGLTRYQASLPAGTIRSGSFTVSAGGGADAGSFQSTVQIGPDIVITTPLAGKIFSSQNPIIVNWTGGDASEWVTLILVGHWGTADIADTVSVPASAGTAEIRYAACCGFGATGGAPNMEIIVQVTPVASAIPAFSSKGISLGGQHLWQYTHRFEGVGVRQP
jgi:uncharacterized protein (TIGR03437 family)